MRISPDKQLTERTCVALGALRGLNIVLEGTLHGTMRKHDDWKRGTLAAVNHSGDSDSTGSITGAILGALLGVELIPTKWIQNVEDSGRIQKIANDMFRIFKNGEELSFAEYPPG